jgi:DNA-binding protein YbaB
VLVDEAWIEEAIERYQRVERLLADFDKAVGDVEVTVNSPDGLVELVVGGDGVIRAVSISDAAAKRGGAELSRAVAAAISAAADAAAWARERLQQEMFGPYRSLAKEK